MTSLIKKYKVCRDSNNTEIMRTTPSHANTHLWPSAPIPTPLTWEGLPGRNGDSSKSPNTMLDNYYIFCCEQWKLEVHQTSWTEIFPTLWKQPDFCPTRHGNYTQHPRIAEENRDDRRQMSLFLFSAPPPMFGGSCWTGEMGEEIESGARVNGRNSTGLGASISSSEKWGYKVTSSARWESQKK